MAVETTVTSANFTGTGASATYAPGFYVNSSDQVKVYVNNVLKTIGDDYTVNNVGVSTGCTVVANFPLGSAVYIERQTPITQLVDTQNNETILEDVLDAAFDKLTMIAQEIAGKVLRALLVPQGETGFTLPAAAARANKFLGFDGAGAAIMSIGTTNNDLLRAELAQSTALGGPGLLGFSHNSAYANGTVGSHLKAFVVASDPPFNVRGDDATDNAAGINAAIAAVYARGGGDVILPSGVIRVSATIDINVPNVRLIGQGADTSHGAGTAFPQKTVIKWIGAAAGTVVKVRTPYGATAQRLYGQSVIGVEISGESSAEVGLEIDSIAYGTFQNIHIRHCTTTQYNLKCGVTGTNGPAGEALDLQLCNFSRLSFDTRNTAYVATSATGWVIDGSTNANVSGNIFELLTGIYGSGTAFSLIRADNNVFTRCSAFRAGGAGAVYTWDLTGANSGTGLGCYGNTFVQIGWDSTYGFRMGESNGADSMNTRVNTILGYDEANGGQPPVVGGNSRVIYLSSKGVLDTVSRINMQQLGSSLNDGMSFTESANRHDLYAIGQTLTYAGNGFAGTFKASGSFDLNSAVGAYKVDGVQVVQTRKTGWTAPTGTATRATFATGSVTLSVLAEHVKALIDDLTAHGLIGA